MASTPISAMIDIVFLLIIFFVVLVAFAVYTTKIKKEYF